jgi:hypothetical protein
MRQQVVAKIKPAAGFAHLFHLSLVVVLPLILYILVRAFPVDFFQLALILVLLSKWRMFAVRPRYWPANLRANGIDIIVAIATITFMSPAHSHSIFWELTWAVVYGAWLVGLKPRSDVLSVSLQALLGQLFGLMALFLAGASAPLYVLVLGSGAICYLAARHFFDSFEEGYSRLLSYAWGYFGAALTWLLGHWLLFYGVLAQPTLLLTVIGYGLAALYYFDHYDRLSKLLQRQFVLVMIAIVVVVLALSNWGDKII